MIISLHGEQMAPDTSGNSATSSSPPFWELEALIASGCDLGTALALISARRNQGSLASRWRPTRMLALSPRQRLAS